MNLTDEKRTVFNSLFGEYDYVCFENSDQPNVEETAYRPGRGLYLILSRNATTIKYTSVSIGYRAKRLTSSGTVYGFVSCAHGVITAADRNLYYGTGFKKVVGYFSTSQLGGKG